jgi:hypothetical protein
MEDVQHEMNGYLYWGDGVAGDPHKQNSAASKTVKTCYLNITLPGGGHFAAYAHHWVWLVQVASKKIIFL